ncbi:MAG: EAL domain-containing protein [Lysobacterales bacterium]
MSSTEAAASAEPTPPFRVYSTADGMSQADASALAQDHNGYLWMTTLRGLNRFDGTKFVSLTIAQGMRRNHLTALSIDPDNRVWAGDSTGGVTIVNNNRVMLVINPPPGPPSQITGIVNLSPNAALVSTLGNGVWQLTPTQTAQRWQRLEGLPTTTEQLIMDRKSIYLRSGNELWTARRDTPLDFQPTDTSITTIGQSADGQVGYATTDGSGWYGGISNGKKVPLSRQAKLISPGSRYGFWQIDGDRLIDPEGRTQQLPTGDIQSIYVDREDVVWLGSSKGLIRFLGFRFTHYSLNESRDGRLVWSITQDRAGRYWFGTDDSLLMMHQGELTVMNAQLNLPKGPVRDLLSDQDGAVWAAVRGLGLYRITPDLQSIERVSGTEGLQLLDLTETPDGALWMSTLSSGVLRIDPVSGELQRSSFPANGSIYTIAASGENEIWAGVSNQGIFQITLGGQGQLRHERLPNSDDLINPFIGQVIVTEPGTAWVSTGGGGIFRYRKGNVQNIGEGSPLASQNVYLIHPMENGSLLVGADEGLYQINLANRHIYRHYPLNGFVATESNVHATYVDRSGDLWLGTVAGATKMNPSLPVPTTPDLTVAIIQAHVGSDPEALLAGEPVIPEDGGLTFSYRAVSLLDPYKVQYSYMLAGLDAGYSTATEISSVQYSSLGAGDYTFQVRARLSGNTWSEPVVQSFSVLPPIWQRPWFLGLAALTSVLLVFVVVQLRTQQIASVNRRLREEVAERTRSIDEARQRLEESNRLLEYQANFDELTGLLNRRSFEKRLNDVWSSAPTKKTKSYLMFMDLDQFKIVNDTCGHAAGDQLLCEVANVIEGCVGSEDSVGRLGGDEFGVLAINRTVDEVLDQAERVRKVVDELLFPWESQVFRIGVSIGCVPIDRRRGDVNELQQLADAACYAAKEAGRNQVHLVQGEKDLARAHRGEMRWVQRLHDAMDNNRFALFGQKIVPLHGAGNEPERMEVLLRMRDIESQKLVPPGAFLPAAERYGLSIKLDEWVVSNLLKTLFVHESFHAEGRRYWVNLSGASVGDAKFSQALLSLMENSQLPPGMVNFEITETAVIRSVSEAAKLICALKEMGCALALDDFGSGLSSFGYLKRLNVDYLKIDGMFIRDIVKDRTDQIFVKSIIDIAHSLNIKTIVEFVENDEILAVVRDLGADFGQGFGIHRPELLMPHFPQIDTSPLSDSYKPLLAGAN